MRTTVLHDRAVKLSKATVHVFSDSVLCLGRIHEYSRSTEAWKDKIECFTKSHEYCELDCIDGEPFVFEWTIFPGHTRLQWLREIQRTMAENRIQLAKVEDRLIFMSMYNDIDCGKAANQETCISNSHKGAAYTKRFLEGHQSFFGPGTEEVLDGTHTYKPLGDSGHLTVRGTSALSPGLLKRKGGGKLPTVIQRQHSFCFAQSIPLIISVSPEQ